MDRSPGWRGQRDTSQRRFWRMVLISVLAHAPLTPAAALVGLIGMLAPAAPSEHAPPSPPITAIPVDLLSGDTPGPSGAAAEAESNAKAAKPEGAQQPSPNELDTPGEEDGKPKPTPADKPTLGAAEKPRAGKSVGDPVAMAGSAGKVADANANVRLLVFNDRIRSHPLGQRIGVLLGAAKQWRDFLGPGGLDPVRDIDRVLIAGPQLKDSSQVVVVLKVKADAAQMRQAVDALVRRDPEGKWLDGDVPAARAKADRAERVFVLPKPGIVIVTPPSAAEHAIKVGKDLRFPNPKGKEALTTYVITPWRAFVGIPFEVPKSIKWVRMSVVATEDGGAYAQLIAEDESAASAKKNAALLTERLNTVTRIDLTKRGGAFGKAARFLFGDEVRLLEPVSFEASGKEIRGKVVATPKQLGTLLEAISGYAEQLAKQNKKAGTVVDAGADSAQATAPAAEAPANASGEPSANDPSPLPEHAPTAASPATPRAAPPPTATEAPAPSP
ncbi:MAG: hypothetical protein R3B13_22435 [Polyangiaceae bacterium]